MLGCNDKVRFSLEKIAETLETVAGAVVGQFERKALLDQILGSTMEILNAEVCSIFLRKEDEPSKIECVAGSGFAQSIVDKLRL
jgi:signal transduction protein with GAF and PtsI domain